MKRYRAVIHSLLMSAAIGPCFVAQAADELGIAALRARDASLTGAGVSIGQAEAANSSAGNDYQVNPSHPLVNQPASLFTFHPTAGTESSHADGVGAAWYGASIGVSPGVAKIDVYLASTIYNNFVLLNVAIPSKIVNQSFRYGGTDTVIDRNYDWYGNSRNVLFVNALGRGAGGTDPAVVDSPGSMFNGITVGPSDGLTTGPTTDLRSKPDLIAPTTTFGSDASYTASIVSGVATIIVQAGQRGDGGAGTSGASGVAIDNRTIKAILLNSAVKPADWAHTPTTPLDPRYGAGVVNANNAYTQLVGGRQAVTTSTSTTSGGAHAPPTGVSGSVASLIGWNNQTISTTPIADAVHHYFFDLPTASAVTSYTLTSTLAWERLSQQASINNLDLYLFRDGATTPLALSNSSVDNVEQLYTSGLTPGRYDLEVVFRGSGLVTTTDTYALAYSFAAVPEPTSLALMACAFGLLSRRRVRRASAQ